MEDSDKSNIAAPKIPENCIFSGQVVGNGDIKVSTIHCSPFLDLNTITVKKFGGMTKLNYKCASVAKGVNTHDIHDFNVFTGYVLPDDETAKVRREESVRVSISRTINEIRELVASNSWGYWNTITLSSELWNRFNPEGLQFEIKEEARRWQNKSVHKEKPYKGYKYLFIPERHANGAIHLHGFTTLFPDGELIPYTFDDVSSDKKLPEYICQAVNDGKEIYHCRDWDRIFGWNVVEPIIDLDKTANYATKYVAKDIENSPFKTRYWRSRGLKKAETVGVFQMVQSETALKDYLAYIAPITAVTKNGELMHKEYYRPKAFPNDEDILAGINTIIDREAMTTDEVMTYLATKYERYEVNINE